ncbi:MAG TPA: sialidase family protein [Methylophilaceae bacterium]|nr:sialidase family protein [Methylophilaceae bacterium]
MLKNLYIKLCGLILLGVSVVGQAQPGHMHDHAADAATPLATSAAFDAKGSLWRVRVEDGFVLVDHSDDFGKEFSKAQKINRQPQRIGTEGDARPKIAIGPEGNLYLTWTQALSKPYSGHIWFARSTDGGRSFSNPVIVHEDRAEITHRFDALAVAPTGRVFVAWVDKRDLIAAQAVNQPYEGAAIYYAISDDGGDSFAPERKLADASCECCRIALAVQPAGTVVGLWRHLFEGGVRDHAIAEIDPGKKIDPGNKPLIHRATFGNWKIDACPHHGPALARGGDWGWHMAWFDGESESSKAGLYYARMDGAAWVSSPAKRFGDAERQAGHPALLSLNGHNIEEVWLAWRELSDEGSQLRLAYSGDGGRSWDAARDIAATAGSADYPQLLSYQGRAYLAWNTAREGFRLITLEAAP